jgi:hypothetical protein
MSPWKYDVGETPKRRHHWDRGYADFVEYQCGIVGKCPNNISNAEAERLLNQGIEWSPPNWEPAYPSRIYVVHNGAVYRAKPTNPGVSYHGFPETGENLRKLPGSVKKQIMESAQNQGCEEQVRRWFNR